MLSDRYASEPAAAAARVGLIGMSFHEILAAACTEYDDLQGRFSALASENRSLRAKLVEVSKARPSDRGDLGALLFPSPTSARKNVGAASIAGRAETRWHNVLGKEPRPASRPWVTMRQGCEDLVGGSSSPCHSSPSRQHSARSAPAAAAERSAPTTAPAGGTHAAWRSSSPGAGASSPGGGGDGCAEECGDLVTHDSSIFSHDGTCGRIDGSCRTSTLAALGLRKAARGLPPPCGLSDEEQDAVGCPHDAHGFLPRVLVVSTVSAAGASASASEAGRASQPEEEANVELIEDFIDACDDDWLDWDGTVDDQALTGSERAPREGWRAKGVTSPRSDSGTTPMQPPTPKKFAPRPPRLPEDEEDGDGDDIVAVASDER